MSIDQIISIVCNIFTAVGTVGAVVVALWFGFLGYKDKQPKLSVFATIGVLYPDNQQYLMLYCVNVGYQSILVTNFAFKPKKSKAVRILINPTLELKNSSINPTPSTIGYSENIQQHFDLKYIEDENFKKFICKYKWFAKIQLKRWRVIARTNLKEFEGKLSEPLVEQILNTHFKN